MTDPVRYMHHPASQPCRAVHQLMLENDIPFVEEIVDLMGGLNEEEKFKRDFNPTGQVPILVDGDFVVWESAAIGFYLNEKYVLAPNWFGDTIYQRARIQQYLHWHSTTLRRGAGAFFYMHFAESIWGARDYSREIEKGYAVLEESMGIMNQWLEKSLFLCGDEISFADLQGFHEFMSHHAGRIISDDQWAEFKQVKVWFERMLERPHSQDVSETIIEVGRVRASGQQIPMSRRTSLAKGTEIQGSGTINIPYENETRQTE